MQYTNKDPRFIQSVRLYDYDTGENFGDFECFHQVTEFLNTNELSVVKLKTYTEIKHQSWGLRRWTPQH